MQRVLRPLTFSDLFDEIFDLYKKNFVLLIGTTALVYIPLQLINYFLVIGSLKAFTAGMPTKYTPNTPPPDPSVFFHNFIPMMERAALGSIIAIPLSLFMAGAITWAVSASYLGERPTILKSYKAVLPRLITLIGASILTWIIYAIAFTLCCLPVIPAAIFLAFVSQVIVLEGTPAFQAIERSFNLAKYDWTKVFGVLAVSAVLVWVCSAVVSVPLGILRAFSHANPASMTITIQVAAQSIVNILVMPLTTLALVLLYYDIRVRKEGFDIQLLAQNMGQNTPTEG